MPLTARLSWSHIVSVKRDLQSSNNKSRATALTASSRAANDAVSTPSAPRQTNKQTEHCLHLLRLGVYKEINRFNEKYFNSAFCYLLPQSSTATSIAPCIIYLYVSSLTHTILVNDWLYFHF